MIHRRPSRDATRSTARFGSAGFLGALLAVLLLAAPPAPQSAAAQGTAAQSTAFQGPASYGSSSAGLSERVEDRILTEMATSPLLARLETLTRPQSRSHRPQTPATVLRAPSEDRRARPSPWLTALVVGLVSTVLVRGAWNR